MWKIELKNDDRRGQCLKMTTKKNVVIEEDFLFNSVWISIPVNEEKGALSKKINHMWDDLSVRLVATPQHRISLDSNGRGRQSRSAEKLKLERSRHHKITFELRGVAADIVVFPPGNLARR